MKKKSIMPRKRSITVAKRNQAKERLLETESLFKAIYDAATDGILIADQENKKFIMGNKSICRQLGYNLEEIKKLGVMDIHPKIDLPYVVDQFERQSKGEFALGKDIPVKRKDGTVFYADVNSAPIKIDGKIYIVGIFRDITERKRIEEGYSAHVRFMQNLDKVNRAIEGENDLDQMMNNALKAVLSIFDCDRTWLFYPCDPKTPSFRVPMEITKPEYPGAKVLNVDAPLPLDMAQNLKEALESADPVTYVAGTERPINKVSAEQFGVKSQMFVALYPKIGKPWAFGLHQCSSPRVWTKEEKLLFKEIGHRISDGLSSLLFLRELQESEERFRRLAENAQDVIYRMSLPDGKYEYVSPSALSVFGYSPEEFYKTPKFIEQIIHPDWHQYFEEHWANLINGKMPSTYEYQIVHKSGGIRWLNQRNILLRDNAGNPKAIEGIVTDITERKQKEENLKFINILLSTQQEASIDGILVVDEKGKILNYNHRFVEIWGIPNDIIATKSDELALKFVTDKLVSPQEFLDRVKYLYEHCNETSREEILLKDGRALDRYSAPMIAQGNIYYGRVWYFRDITGSKRTEVELKQSEEKFSKAFQTSPNAITITRAEDGVFVDVNNAFTAISGYSREEALSGSSVGLKLWVNEEDRKHVVSDLRAGRTVVGQEFQFRMKNSTIIVGLFSAQMIRLNNIPCILSSIADITERKRSEEETKRIADMKNEFVTTVSHEMRTPLNMVIEGLSQILDGLAGQINKELELRLTTIKKNTDRLARIINSILSIAVIESGEMKLNKEQLDINEIITKLVAEFDPQAKNKQLELKVKSSSEKINLYGDKDKIIEIFINLIGNALKFTQTGFIEIAVKDLENEVECVVSDTGIGIAPENLARVFGKFQQFRKKVGPGEKGTGLGLAIVRALVEAQGGGN